MDYTYHLDDPGPMGAPGPRLSEEEKIPPMDMSDYKQKYTEAIKELNCLLEQAEELKDYDRMLRVIDTIRNLLRE